MRLRTWILGACLALAAGGVGCGLLGTAVGVTTDPVTGETRSVGDGGLVGAVGHLIGLPWVATAVAALAGLYAEYKRRGWKAAAVSTFDAVETFKSSPEGAKVWDNLKATLGEAHADAKVKALVDKALGNT